MSRRGDDSGSVTAEFAVVVPVALVVVMLTVGTLAAAGTQIRLEHGAAQAARLAARGESHDRAAAAVHAAVSGAALEVQNEGDLVCVAASATADVPLPLPPLRARSCALAGGL